MFEKKTAFNQKRLFSITMLVLIITLVALIVYGIQSSSNEQGSVSTYETITLEEREPIVLSGEVIPLETENLYFDPTMGRIDQVEVESGQTVEEGDVLFTYDNPSAQRELELNQMQRDRLVQERQTLVDALSRLTGKDYDEYGNEIESEEAEENTRYEIKDPLSYWNQTERDLHQQLREIDHKVQELDMQIDHAGQQEVKAPNSGVVLVNDQDYEQGTSPIVQINSEEQIIEGYVNQFDYLALDNFEDLKIIEEPTGAEKNGELVEVGSFPLPTTTEGQVSSPTNEQYRFVIESDENLQPGFTMLIYLYRSGYHVPNSAVFYEEDQAYIYENQDNQVVKTPVEVEEVENQLFIDGEVDETTEVFIDPSPLEEGGNIHADS